MLFAAGLLLWISVGARAQEARPKNRPAHRALWVTAYYADWEYDRLKPQDIDYSAFTHLIHFAAQAHRDGTLEFDMPGLSVDRSSEVIAAAHKAHRPVLLCIGGEDSGPDFAQAIAPERRATLIANLVTAVQQRGYDGLDIDMEPVKATDADNYAAFIRGLRAAMQQADPHWLLTAAVGEQPTLFAALQDQFDQINLMTYDMSGPWEGWVSWYNAPLHSSKLTFPGSSRPLPSMEAMVQEWLQGGVRPEKLGIGLAFFGMAWHGISAPNAAVTGVTAEEITYQDLMQKYYRPDRYHWQEDVAVPYLSVTAPDPKDTLFISYDDERSLGLKVGYARNAGLGGMILWELGSGYRSDALPGQRDVLLQTVKRAAFGKSRPLP
jgi:chitinase